MRIIFRFKHIHGIDLAEERQLAAHQRSHEEIRSRIGCDTLVYLPLDRLVEACLQSGTETPVTSFEVGLFSGSYVTLPAVPRVDETVETPLEVRSKMETRLSDMKVSLDGSWGNRVPGRQSIPV